MVKKLFVLLVVLIFQGCGGVLWDSDLEMIEARVVERDWNVERIVLDETLELNFLLPQPNRELDPHEIIDETRFLSLIFDLVAFTETELYVLSLNPELDGGHDGNPHEGYTEALSRINLAENVIDYGLSGSIGSFFGGFSFAHNINFFDDFAWYSFFEGWIHQGVVVFHYGQDRWTIDDTGEVERLERTGWSAQHDLIHSPQMPIIAYSQDYIILNFILDNAYILGYINFEDLASPSRDILSHLNIVVSNEFTVEDGLFIGRLPMYAGGGRYGIYFQVIELDGRSSVYFYSFLTGEYRRLLSLSDRIEYVNGADGVLVVDYFGGDPLVETGRIVFVDDGAVVTIPMITPVNPITYSFIGGGYIYILSDEYVIFYDVIENAFSVLGVGSGDEVGRSSVRFFGGGVGWLGFYGEGVVVYRGGG